MIRALVFFLKLAILVAVAVWLADQPGEVVINWQGYRIETTVGILLLAAAILAVIAALLYRFWGALRRAPGTIGGGLRNRRRQRGYKALTQGMVSVAAGEPDEARRLARKADSLLDEPPLTMLLSAQAAQLNGDETAAKRYFTSMLESAETRFLGLRGLLRQAEREGDWDAALDCAKRAYEIRPQTPWVLSALFDLGLKSGDLDRALKASEDLRRHGQLSREDEKRRRGVLFTEKARRAEAAGDAGGAREYAAQAHKLAPELPAAAAIRARLLLEDRRSRPAAKAIETTWALHPHPDLVPLYLRARPGKTELERFNALGRLVRENPEHRESLMALGRAALAAELWGEARRYLQKAGGTRPTESVCRLMAEIEERENGDVEAARTWLLRAAEAPDDPAWVCGECGAVAAEWHGVCAHCGGFDTFAWRSPPHVVDALGAPVAHARLEYEGGDGAGEAARDAEATPAEIEDAATETGSTSDESGDPEEHGRRKSEASGNGSTARAAPEDAETVSAESESDTSSHRAPERQA